jgi:glutaminyl-peptide cyclotransferase
VNPDLNRRLLLAAGALCLAAGALLVATQLWPSGSALSTGAIDDMVELASEADTDAATLAADDDFPAIEDSAIRDADERTEPRAGTITVLDTIPHDTGAFTQGFEFDGDRLYESTGLIGQSTLRELDPATGAVLRSIPVDDVFAEGLTIVGDEAIQLTWTEGVAFRYDVDTFELLETHTYEGQGWGICDEGDVLRMSDGTPTLQTRDVTTFELLDTVEVTFNGALVERINELECVGGSVWANIWQTPLIIEIDPDTGVVLTVLDGSELRPESTVDDSGAVLNGIAHDASTDTWLLTGKRWPLAYRVTIE